ncbi:hypothetical protein BT63DRAFT_420973 [Microthyrium microscopicum]|uniref:Mid2 domain-containing protein n=1 Tax=Microthyrium microscopicum TaxID=703497 RepID=A0A6A6UNW6_9PEZI|nr:hypothetical protein BT63DRAFT_420973 [Microthyrium microscopicum]
MATLLSTTWTNPCGNGNIPEWTKWASPTPAPVAPTLFWADTQPSSCYPPSFSSMAFGNSTYSPGVCPSGYATATSTVNSQNKVTNGVCCPSGFSLYSIATYGLDCWTSFSSGSPGTGTLLFASGGGTGSQAMAFTSGAANGYSINIAWEEADFTSSGASKTAGSSASSSGSKSGTTGNAGSDGNTGSTGGGLSTGGKIGLGVGLGIGFLLIVILLVLWILRKRKNAKSNSTIWADENGSPKYEESNHNFPELDGNTVANGLGRYRPELDGNARAELDGVAGGMPELETRGNAAELDGNTGRAIRELDGGPIPSKLNGHST